MDFPSGGICELIDPFVSHISTYLLTEFAATHHFQGFVAFLGAVVLAGGLVVIRRLEDEQNIMMRISFQFTSSLFVDHRIETHQSSQGTLASI